MTPFWPNTFAGWVGAVSPILTVIVIAVALYNAGTAARWRHEDRADERRRLASSVLSGLTVTPTHIRSDQGVELPTGQVEVSTIRLSNAGSEVIKSVVVEVLHQPNGQVLPLLRRGRDQVTQLLLTHLAAGEEHLWEGMTAGPLTKVEADDGSGEMRAPVVPRITWFDAAGWKWQMIGNEEPHRLA